MTSTDVDIVYAYGGRRSRFAERDCDIVLRRNGGETYRSIGEAYGITGNRVKQIVDYAERKRRHPRRKRFLDILVPAFGKNGAIDWLYSEQGELNSERPVLLIEEGRGEEVGRVLDALIRRIDF